ncbi:unnamed protein product [Caenorhabditis bovis]|uniref:Ubiquitin carboxyl-terminal hydrolase n=1 Tax=Caenorhabditis bovis TaxID=2654633 RepID=A0A8S1F1D9_9PELO|nr:unnamed protein product [Caenorhabditis bovis]
MVVINVKWAREKYVVDVDTSQPPIVFKSQLFTLTNVLPERQKVLIQGRTLGDETWDGIKLSDNMTIMMMGNVGDIMKAPQPVSGESSTENGGGKKDSGQLYPIGMTNLGNTCYFNSCVQLFKEFDEMILTDENVKKVENSNERLGFCLAELLRKLRDKNYAKANNISAVSPFAAVATLSNTFPQFEQFKQQDANECFVALLNTIIRTLKIAGVDVKDCFTVKTVTTAKCLESEGEEESKTESFNQLTCYINKDVRFLQTGIKSGFDEEMERHSNLLGRDAKWQKNTRISRLPKYLTVNLNRFFFKEQAKINAKILKAVQFPISLDVYDLCTDELKEKLSARRGDIKLEEDAKLDREMRKKTLDKEQAKAIFDDGVPLSSEFENDPGSNNSGFYELKGIITHKGRSSNDGHYVAWIRSSEDGKWRLFDDDDVSVVDEEAVLKTAGGGDWHSAYLLVYESRVIKKFPELPPVQSSAAEAQNQEAMEISNGN